LGLESISRRDPLGVVGSLAQLEKTAVEAVKPSAPAEALGSPFLGRHQFLIYRLFSLAGVIPIGAYVVSHLLVNSTVFLSVPLFQTWVDRIHSQGEVVVTILEWAFIFLPILFHAAVGLWIISGGLPNAGAYPYGSNIRYTLQRVTAFFVAGFILYHLWQMHHYARPLGGGEFNPEHAASSAATVLGPIYVKIIYIVGNLCAVYHLANGLWTFGITWGIWTSDCAQRRAGVVCAAFGILLACVSMGALYGMSRVNIDEAKTVEDRMQHNLEMANGQIAIGQNAETDKPAKQSP
jgi:succinate dehydrogenase / fumarate reductase cytochrome b subunit